MVGRTTLVLWGDRVCRPCEAQRSHLACMLYTSVHLCASQWLLSRACVVSSVAASPPVQVSTGETPLSVNGTGSAAAERPRKAALDTGGSVPTVMLLQVQGCHVVWADTAADAYGPCSTVVVSRGEAPLVVSTQQPPTPPLEMLPGWGLGAGRGVAVRYDSMRCSKLLPFED